MNPDEIFRSWMDDMNALTNDIYELFATRRTFRDVAEIFKNNPRLRETGGHLWSWMLLNYVANVLMRVRRLVDSQHGTVSLKRLLHAIVEQPTVITRARRHSIHGPIESDYLRKLVDDGFTKTWVTVPDAAHPENDHVDPAIVKADLNALEVQLETVAEFAHRTVAHKTREAPGDLTYAEMDAAFDAIEKFLKKYHILLLGPSLLQAEPTPQFNTHEVFTFPWIEPRKVER
jgi:hypothetical protein